FGTKKATMNLRIHDGKPVYEGEQIEIGGDEAYLPVSRYHYYHPDEAAIAARFRKQN
ncbi:MAG: thymidine kinase, partial [Weissella confusa]